MNIGYYPALHNIAKRLFSLVNESIFLSVPTALLADLKFVDSRNVQFSKIMGQLYGLLYLPFKSLTLDEMAGFW